MQIRLRLLFQIFYSTSYTLLYTVLLGLLLINPVDLIRQALVHGQIYNVFFVAGAYLVTLVLAILNYAARLWTARSALGAIPKTWMPIEKADVGNKVRKMIVDDFHRSAMIAWDARPRIAHFESLEDVQHEVEEQQGPIKARPTLNFSRRIQTFEKDEAFLVPPHSPPWGEIEHVGWSSPFSPDLANLQYSTVIVELPNLIEAKAVSLAPSTPGTLELTAPILDARAVELLQRPETMGLRDYITHLINLGILPPSEITYTFLKSYEHARFSGQQLSEAQFRAMMKAFSDILRSMKSFDTTMLDDAESGNSVYETDIDDDASSKSTPVTPRSRSITSDSASAKSNSSQSSSTGTIRTAPSRRAGTIGGTPRRGSRLGMGLGLHQLEMTTSKGSGGDHGPTTPSPSRSRQRSTTSRNISSSSFAQSRPVYQGSSSSASSSPRSASLSRQISGTRSVSGASNSSLRSGSSGSVIRLNLNYDRDPRESPYTLTISR